MIVRSIQILIAVGLTFPGAVWADERPIRYAFQVFQLNSGFSQKTSLKKKIWKASDRTWDKMKEEIVLFDDGEFRNGKDTLVFRSNRCQWNNQILTFEEGHKAKLPEKKIKLISSPYVKRKEKELVKFKIQSEQPYQYMESQGKDVYKLKEIKLPTGLDIAIRAHTVRRDVYDVDHLKFSLRIVSERESVKGTTLPVGKPVLHESEYTLALRVDEYDSYGILLQPKGTESMFIIRLEIDDK